MEKLPSSDISYLAAEMAAPVHKKGAWYFLFSRLCMFISLSKNISILSLSSTSFIISLSLGYGIKGSVISPTHSMLGSPFGS